MSKKVPKRLQGPEWYEKKDGLIMTKYRINEKGHIKGTYTDMEGNLYSHWFSNKEVEEFNETNKPKEERELHKIGKYKLGIRANESLSMYYIPEEDEEDTVTAYKEAIKGIRFGKDISEKLDSTTIEHFQIPTMSNFDIEASIDNVLSREELIKQMNDFVLEDEKERYVRALLNRLNAREKVLKEIKQHIKDKVRKSFEVDWGISDKRGDRLFTETIVELQLIEQMVDKGLESKGDKNE